jgi:hypothetical protein
VPAGGAQGVPCGVTWVIGGARSQTAPQLPAAPHWPATFFAIAQTRASMNSDAEVCRTADLGADFDTGLDAELETAMADDFYKGLHAGGSAALRRGSAPRANCVQTPGNDPGKLERAKGFEPSTPTLARSCSTPELHPHPLDIWPKWQFRPPSPNL